MAQVHKFMSYGFIPWHLLSAFQELNAQTIEATASSVVPLAPEQEVTRQEVYPSSGEPATDTVLQTLAQVKFRQALIEVDNPGDFWSGVVGGQVAALEEAEPLTGAQVFALFEDAVRDVEFSETWLAGYLLGLGDALLRQRKRYPRAYIAHLQSVRMRSKQRQER